MYGYCKMYEYISVQERNIIYNFRKKRSNKYTYDRTKFECDTFIARI